MDLQTALKEIKTWSVEDRLELLERVWDQLDETDWEPELTEEQLAEAERRFAAHKTNPKDALTWEEVKAHVRRRR